MHNSLRQLGSPNAMDRSWQTPAFADADGGVRLSGTHSLPAQFAYCRFAVLTVEYGGAVT